MAKTLVRQNREIAVRLLPPRLVELLDAGREKAIEPSHGATAEPSALRPLRTPDRGRIGPWPTLDVVGADLAFEAQHIQYEFANPTRLLASLSLQGDSMRDRHQVDGPHGFCLEEKAFIWVQ
jgi:hypothetical protein